ncbi:MAG: hypothetical protein J5510_09035 [Prevotella sp.]|nr:hypothetical protein [Prevotella sp.]
MKKFLLPMTFIALAVMFLSACDTKPAATTEKTEEAEQTAAVNINSDNMMALINADWDAVPDSLLNAMGIKALKSYRKEVKDAQCDVMHYYYGKGATVELNDEGDLTKITADDENAVVLYLTAESASYGTIAFRNEADYNDFKKKAETSEPKSEEEESVEFEFKGKNTAGEETGYEKDKWYFVEFNSTI